MTMNNINPFNDAAMIPMSASAGLAGHARQQALTRRALAMLATALALVLAGLVAAMAITAPANAMPVNSAVVAKADGDVAIAAMVSFLLAVGIGAAIVAAIWTPHRLGRKIAACRLAK